MMKKTLLATLLVSLCCGISFAATGEEPTTCTADAMDAGIPALEASPTVWESWAKARGIRLIPSDVAGDSLDSCPYSTCSGSCGVTPCSSCGGFGDSGLTACQIPGGNAISCTGGKTVHTKTCSCLTCSGVCPGGGPCNICETCTGGCGSQTVDYECR